MILNKLYLQDFRQFGQKTLTFSSGINLLSGKNGCGKTTVLEAIYLLSSGKSFRAKKTEQMLRFAQPLSRVFGLLDDQTRLGVTLTTGNLAGKKVRVKTFSINKTNLSAPRFIGNLLAACFRPEDLRLIEGSAARRRDYLNSPLALVSLPYRESIKKCAQIIIRRNKTLTDIKLGKLPPDTLEYYNQQLIQFSQTIQQQRQKFIDFANTQQQIFSQFHLNYYHRPVNAATIETYQKKEIACGFSLLGPQKDDFDIDYYFSGQNTPKSLLTYGSRGQHRLAVLWLKMIELAYLKSQTALQPLLLLDDICSELDQEAKKLVYALSCQQQTLVTATDNMIELWGKNAQLLNLENATQNS